MKIHDRTYPSNSNFTDMSGKLTPMGFRVLNYAGKNIHGQIMYRCKCPHCGREIDAAGFTLFGDNSDIRISCGCLAPQSETIRAIPDLGRKHDRIYVSYTFYGKTWTFPITIWAEIVQMTTSKLRTRLYAGMNVKDALTVIDGRAKTKTRRRIHIPKQYRRYNRPDMYAVSYR